MTNQWSKEEEARRLALRFAGLTQTVFAKQHGMPGGASMISQHIHGHRPISIEAAVIYARAFGVTLAEISPRLAGEVASASEVNATGNAEPVSMARYRNRTPVIGTAKLGQDGFYEVLSDLPGAGDGSVEGYSGDANAYALRVRGDSMHPAIRHGSFVVVEPNSRCVPGEYVAIALVDGRKMVKELMIERADEIVVESVNGNHRQIIARTDISLIHPVAAVISASKWRPE